MALLTALDVIAAACARIGEDAPTLDAEDGNLSQPIYEDVVGFTLGIYTFSFSRQIFQLAKVSDAVPLSGWTYVYDLPPERNGPPIYCTDDVTDPDRRYSRYSLVGATVHTDADPFFAMCKFSPAPHLWSPTFKSVVITALAGRLAFALAADRATMETLVTEAYGPPSDNYRGGQMRAAINEDSQATPPRKPDWGNNPFERARRG